MPPLARRATHLFTRVAFSAFSLLAGSLLLGASMPACSSDAAAPTPRDADAGADAVAPDAARDLDAEPIPDAPRDAPGSDAADAARGDAATPGEAGASSDAAGRSLDLDADCPAPDSGDAAATITVNATVYAAGGRPDNGVSVLIQGQRAITAADGTFSLSGVVPPYDVTLASAWGPVTYAGLTRPDPTLVASDTPLGDDVAAVSPHLTPASDAGSPPVAFVLDATGSPGGTFATMSDFNSVAYLSVDWSGSAPATAALTSIEWSGGPSVQVTAAATQALSLIAGSFSDVPVATGPLADPSTLSGTTTVPAGYTPGYMSIGVSDGVVGGDEVARDYTAPGAFSYGLFTGGPSWALRFRATNPAKGQQSAAIVAGLDGGEAAVAVTLPTCALQLASPAPASTLASSCAALSWSAAAPGVVYVVTLSGNGFPPYQLVTGQTSLPVPFALPAGAYTWSVRAISPLASVDAAATDLASGAALGLATGMVASHTECVSAGGTFVVP